jgi:hypothetical protein
MDKTTIKTTEVRCEIKIEGKDRFITIRGRLRGGMLEERTNPIRSLFRNKFDLNDYFCFSLCVGKHK